MSDTNQETNTCKHSGRRRRHLWRRGVMIVLIVGAAAFIGSSIAQARFGHGFHGFGHGHGADVTVEEATDHMTRMADWALDSLDATDEQRDVILALIEAAAPDIVALHDEAAALKIEFHDAVAAQADRATIEALRTQGVDLADRASARGLELMLDIRDELTPEQREQLIERFH